jgi:hypothetical protein
MNSIVEKLNKLEYLTKKQFSWLKENDVNFVENAFTYVGYSQYGDYLNLQVYSEYDHDKRQYEMETGVS